MSAEKTQMYFATDPNARHDEHVVDYHVDKVDLKFTTDAGVFSKMRVDYGSGVLIKAMKNVIFPKKNILDVGTGYGPMGLFAAKFWPDQKVDMVDVNERGLNLARQNAKVNHVDNVDIYSSNCYTQVDNNKKFGLILTNPPIRAGKKVVNEILQGAHDYLVDGGVLLVVIQKKQGEPSARKLMTETYGNCEILTRDKGYYILKSIKEQ